MNTIAQKELPGTTGSDMPPGLSPTTVLVPMLNLSLANDMMGLAAMLAAGTGPSSGYEGSHDTAPRVVALGIVEVPQGQPLTMGLDMARSYRALLDFLPTEVGVGGKKVKVERLVKVARDIPSAVREAALEERAGLALLYWKGYAREPKKYVYGRTTDAILANPPCDVLLARPEGLSKSRRILLPVRGGPTAERSLKLALTLARFMNIPLTVMHTSPARPRGTSGSLAEALGEQPFIILSEQLEVAQALSPVPIDRILTVGDDPAGAVQEELLKDDLLIIGAPSNPDVESVNKTPQPMPRPVTLGVAQQKGPPLLILRAYEPLDLAGYAHKVSARRSRKSWTDMPFEHWFVENTYHSDEYKDPADFVEVKRASGLTLSVGLLTSNDARHLRSEIMGLKKVLQEMHPIADQIAVIDAASTDETVEIARSLGIEVYRATDILPEQGAFPGRGESWWKSLAALHGDIIVWLDPRAVRFHPTTAIALAWPLLRVPTLRVVKAFDPMPHELKTKRNKDRNEPDGERFAPVDMSWGGFVVPRREGGLFSSRIRVQALKPTDLEKLSAAQFSTLPPRGILQVLSPSLAGVMSPFGHDMAARRRSMLSLPTFTGDNFEVGVLLSVASRYGARAIAQVELRHAQPAPPPTPGLRNNIDLLQMLARRLEDPRMRQIAEEVVARLQREIEGGVQVQDRDEIFEVRALGPVERPPIASLPGVS